MIVCGINLYNKRAPSEWSVCIRRGGKARRTTGPLTVAVFGVKSVFGSNTFASYYLSLGGSALARGDRFIAINSGQIRDGAVQVRVSVRHLRGREHIFGEELASGKTLRRCCC